MSEYGTEDALPAFRRPEVIEARLGVGRALVAMRHVYEDIIDQQDEKIARLREDVERSKQYLKAQRVVGMRLGRLEHATTFDELVRDVLAATDATREVAE